MKNFDISNFRYKGRNFMLMETPRIKMHGYSFIHGSVKCIVLKKDLDPIKKQLEFHRLITGRGVRPINRREKHEKF